MSCPIGAAAVGRAPALHSRGLLRSPCTPSKSKKVCYHSIAEIFSYLNEILQNYDTEALE